MRGRLLLLSFSFGLPVLFVKPDNQYGPSPFNGFDSGVGAFAGEVFEYGTVLSLSLGEDLEYEPEAVCGRVRTFDLELEVPSKVGGALVSGMFACDSLCSCS